jgi:pyruvate ferredoxin oxidoreductase gamma subunit
VFQTRFHGRGGQGVVTAAELLSVAAFRAGRHAQAFPSFGSERTGAPVVSYCRIDDRPIRSREPVVVPDALIIQDTTLLQQTDVFAGLADDGYIVINSTRDVPELGIGEMLAGRDPARVITVPATRIAMQHLGRPLPNLVLLGAFAALTGLVGLVDVQAAAGERFQGAVLEGNCAAARQAYDVVKAHVGEGVGDAMAAMSAGAPVFDRKDADA